MVLTPADVHNVAFSRPRIGKRGYDEQEVDLFVDLVEQELVRHLEEEGDLRSRCAEMYNRLGGLQQREAEVTERETFLDEQERDMQKRQSELRRQEARLAQREAQFVKKVSPLPQQLAQLRHREAQVAEREADLSQHEAWIAQQDAELTQREAAVRERETELSEWEDGLSRREVEIRRRVEQQQAIDARVGATNSSGQAPLPLRHGNPLGATLAKPAAVNGASHLQEARAVDSVHGRHDMERMAIRAVTDPLGNTVTETVHERTRRSPIEAGAPAATHDRSAELDQLRQENAELTHSLGLLKSAAALLAAALDRP